MMTQDKCISYVYICFRPWNGTPFYVGKGKGSRWKRHDRKLNSNPHYANIYKKANGYIPVVIVRDNLTDEDACRLERQFISAIGRGNIGPLVNLTDGGDGTSGAIRSQEWRANRSQKAKEMWENPEIRAKLTAPDRNRGGNTQPRTDEFRAAMSARLIGNTHTKGYKHTQEAREKMRMRWKDPEFRARVMASRYASGMYSHEKTMVGTQKRTENYARKRASAEIKE